MIVQTPPLLHISPLILLTFDDFGGECFFARISAISGEFSRFPALSTPRYFIRPILADPSSAAICVGAGSCLASE